MLTAVIVGVAVGGVALASPAGDVPAAVPEAAATARASVGGEGLSIALTVLMLLAPVSLFVLWKRDVIRVGSFARRGLRDTDSRWTPLLLIAALLVFVTHGLGAGLAFSAAAPADGVRTIRLEAVVNIVALSLGIATALGAFLYLSKVAMIPGPRVRARDFGHGLLGLAFTMPLSLAAAFTASQINTLLTGKVPASVGHSTLATLTENLREPWAWVLVGSAVLLAPVFEELLYRGLVQTGVLAATRRVWVSIFITTGVFTLLHIGAVPSWVNLVPIAVLSVAMGVAYERTKSIGVPIVMHVGFNAINTAMAVLASRPG